LVKRNLFATSGLVFLLLLTLFPASIVTSQVEGTELYPAPVPTWLTVAIEQTPYTVLVVIVADFNESGVSMEIRNDTVWWDGGYTYAIEIVCCRENPGSPVAGNEYLGVWTTLGAPPPGNYTLYVLEAAIDPYFIPYEGMNTSHLLLKEKTFTVAPIIPLFSGDGILATLKTYLNYMNQSAEMEIVTPNLYNYTRLWINSTSYDSFGVITTLGVVLNNTSAQNLENVNLTLTSPLGIDLDVVPEHWFYGTIASNSSSIGLFNVTSLNVPVGVYSLSYVLTYSDLFGPHSVSGNISVGIYSANAVWIDSNQTAVAKCISPFNDNCTIVYYNYTHFTTVDGYDIYLYQNFNSSFMLTSFSGSTGSFLLASVLAGIASLATQIYVAYKDGTLGEMCKLLRIAATTILTAAVSDIGWKWLAEKAAHLGWKFLVAALVGLGIGVGQIEAHKLVAQGQSSEGYCRGQNEAGAWTPTISGKGKGDSKPATREGSNVKQMYKMSKLHARYRCDGKTRVWGGTDPSLVNEPVYVYNPRTGKVFPPFKPYGYTNKTGEFDLCTDKDFAKPCDILVVQVGKDTPYVAIGDVHVEAALKPPKANFSATPVNPLAGQMVTFNASASEPGFDGVNVCPIAWYYWDFGDGYAPVNITSVITTHAYTSAGDYVMTLSVYAPPGPEASTEYYPCNTTWLILKVVGLPHSPVANFTEQPKTPYVYQPVYFDASSSLPGFDGDDECPITEYHWDFGDGTSGTGKTIRHVYDKSGNYTVTLVVYAPGIPPYIDPQYVGANTTDTIQQVKQVLPVGGYSFPIERHTTATPLTAYLATITIIAAVFITIRRKTPRKRR